MPETVFIEFYSHVFKMMVMRSFDREHVRNYEVTDIVETPNSNRWVTRWAKRSSPLDDQGLDFIYNFDIPKHLNRNA